MKIKIKRLLKILMEIVICGLIIFLITKMKYMEKEIESLKNSLSQIQVVEQEGKDINQEEVLTITSASMDIIAVGIGLFTLYGGFLSLINVNQSRELSETMRKTKRAIRNQKELSANRFLQEGQLYRTWNRPNYAKKSYELAIEHGKGTFSALVAKYTLISMYADRLSDNVEKLADIEKQFKDFIKELQEEKRFYRGRKYLRADSYFTLACIYANYALNDIDCLKKLEYERKACEMFELAIKEDDENPDIYRNYAAHLSKINKMKECKKQIQLAQKYAKKDIILSEFMDKKRLVNLFRLQNKRSKKEAKAILKEIGIA